MLASMEEPQPSLAPEADKPSPAGPIMDVVAPPPESADEAAPASAPAPDHPKSQPPSAPAHQKGPPQPKPPKAPGVGAAIYATVIIVLGLAALAVYAYIQQQ